jgi:Hemerythrin HHE cation binding domain
MADDKSKRGSPDTKRLNKSEPYEMAYAKSKRASPARKALAGKAGSANGGASARKSAGAATKKSGTTAAKKRGTTRSAPSSGARSRKSASSSSSTKASSSSTRAKSAAPAMKRTNAEPARTRPRTPSTRGTPNPPKTEPTAENTAPRTMREADAVDLLTDDHLEVGALFKQYEKLAKKEAPAEQRRALAQTICAMLKAHTTIEEEIFYPAARRAGIDADMLDEADIEHASAKGLIAQIESGDPGDDHYDAKVKVLGEYITHHVVEEHTEMFPKCRRAGMDLVALRAEMEQRKMSLLADGGDAAVTEAEGESESKPKSPGILASLFAKG